MQTPKQWEYFTGLEKEGLVSLTDEGMTALAALVKELAGVKMATKQAVIESLHSLQDGLSEIEKIIRTTTTVLLAPSVFGPRVDDIVRLWAERVETDILKFGVDEKICANTKTAYASSIV